MYDTIKLSIINIPIRYFSLSQLHSDLQIFPEQYKVHQIMMSDKTLALGPLDN